MFLHPEVRQQFYLAKSHMAHNKPGWTNEVVCEATRTKIWAENLRVTNMFLEEHCYCPGLEVPIEEYERQIRMDEALDDILDGSLESTDDEDGIS